MASEGESGDTGGSGRPVHGADWDRLATEIRAGDSKAFDELYLAIFPALVEFATQLIGDAAAAEDLVQEVFHSLWAARRDRVIHGLRIYLYSAVKKRALNFRRHQGVLRRAESVARADFPPALGEPPARPDHAVDLKELRTTLDRIIHALPEDRQTIVMLRWRHQLSYPEIAEVLGISLAAAQAQVSRVQRTIRPLLERFLERD